MQKLPIIELLKSNSLDDSLKRCKILFIFEKLVRYTVVTRDEQHTLLESDEQHAHEI